MRRSRWFEPYFSPKRPGSIARPQMADAWDSTRSGIYFIRKKETQEVVYVGMSTGQLKKTIYRHFQYWSDRARRKLWGKSERKSYPKFGYEVRFIYTTPEQAAKLEKLYIGKLQPADNSEKYQGYFALEGDATAAAIANQEAALADFYNDAEESPMLKKKEYLEEDYPF